MFLLILSDNEGAHSRAVTLHSLRHVYHQISGQAHTKNILKSGLHNCTKIWNH